MGRRQVGGIAIIWRVRRALIVRGVRVIMGHRMALVNVYDRWDWIGHFEGWGWSRVAFSSTISRI